MQNNPHISPPLILCLETSGRIGSVAIAKGTEFLHQITFSTPMRHSSEIFPAVSKLLDKANCAARHIDQIYISSGPGSFTGLRISSTIAKIMNIAKEIKIVAVNTLDVIAENAPPLTEKHPYNPQRLAVVLDAKRSKFFVAGFESIKGKWHKTQENMLVTPEQFHNCFDTNNLPISLLGEGLVYYKKLFDADKVTFLNEKLWTPQAQKVHKLGYEKAKALEFSDPVTLKPLYLRRPI